MSLLCYRERFNVLTLHNARLKENKFKCESQRSRRELCQQMFNAVKDRKKTPFLLILSGELHHLAWSSCDR